jgi:hypothetical protein
MGTGSDVMAGPYRVIDRRQLEDSWVFTTCRRSWARARMAMRVCACADELEAHLNDAALCHISTGHEICFEMLSVKFE